MADALFCEDCRGVDLPEGIKPGHCWDCGKLIEKKTGWQGKYSQYMLLHSIRPEALEQTVEEFLFRGWELWGGVAVALDSGADVRNRFLLVQAVVWPAERPIFESMKNLPEAREKFVEEMDYDDDEYALQAFEDAKKARK